MYKKIYININNAIILVLKLYIKDIYLQINDYNFVYNCMVKQYIK